MAEIARLANKPHVLVLAWSFPVRSETFVVDHVRGLLAHGSLVTVAAWEIDTDALALVERRYRVRIPVVRIPNRSTRLFRRLIRAVGCLRAGIRNLGVWLRSPHLRDATTLAPSVAWVIGQVRPDLVHAHFGPVGLAAAVATSDSSIPLLVNFHGYDATVVPQRSGWTTYRPLARRGVRLIAHSHFISDRLAMLSLPVDRVQMGYDAEIFYPPDRENTHWNKPLRLIQVGRLVPQKGQRLAIGATALLRDRGREARLCLVGTGPDAEALVEHCRGLEVTNLVDFAGSLTPDDVAERLRDSDVLLAPSIVSPDGSQEGFGRAVIEGIACGLPAVVFPTGGLCDSIAGAGIVCAGTSASDLANGIVAVLESGDPPSWRDRCLGASKDRTLEAMWADYDRVTKQTLAATAL